MINASGMVPWGSGASAGYRTDGTGWLNQYAIQDRDGNPIAGVGITRFIASDQVIADLQLRYPPSEYGDRWQQELQAMSEAGGLRSGTAALDNNGEILRMAPYQQHADDDRWVLYPAGVLEPGNQHQRYQCQHARDPRRSVDRSFRPPAVRQRHVHRQHSLLQPELWHLRTSRWSVHTAGV
ncbi:MAG TPA: hypothetical protein VHN14_13270 [Kofleriaceae bacterium]|jgi:hypothetical protein|nr:hypothetical protein [Kofleriaceae bacterium]